MESFNNANEISQNENGLKEINPTDTPDTSQPLDFSNDGFSVSDFASEKDGNKESEGQIKENSISEQGKLDTSKPIDFSSPEKSNDSTQNSDKTDTIEEQKFSDDRGLTPLTEAKSFVDSLFKEKSEVSDGYYNSYETRSSNIPVDGVRGHWEGERGESKYVPSDETEKGKAAKDKLSEKGMDGIEYRNAEPDFSECAEATVEIDDMTENRENYYDEDGNLRQGNFSQADEKCAEQWNSIEKDGKSNWTAADVRDWRRENGYSWHERCDTRTMDLVSRDIHNYFKHYGGCSECRVRDANVDGGGFDE